ncbi:MAG TPA: response regulator, partial [Terriglobia bacterium]|nr:response regulator [Terriglobia bacterium]
KDDLLYYSAVLQNLRYEVRSSASYTEAANLFAREDFDLVIVSEGGSRFEGRTVLSHAIEADRTTPVLVLTRNPSMNSYVEAMQMGAFDYVEKPLTPSELAELVKWHLRLEQPVRGVARERTREGTSAGNFVH